MEKICPKIGIFYFCNDKIIAPEHYQKHINPVTYTVKSDKRLNNPGEHRDLWDECIAVDYPEIIVDYKDNHKLLPRGRVGFYTKNNNLIFLITLDKCIKDKEEELKEIYCLWEHNVEFSYGTLNYKCRDCIK